jgi:hypothetical protein
MKCTPVPRHYTVNGAIITGLLLMSSLGGLAASGVWFGWVRVKGEREWREAQAELKAAGYSLEFAAIASPAIPEIGNFGAAPVLRGITEQENRQSEVVKANIAALNALDARRPPNSPPDGPNAPVPGDNEPQDWKAWHAWLSAPMKRKVPADEPDPAKAVLAALRSQGSVVIPKLIAAAKDRRGAQFIPCQRDRIQKAGGERDLSMLRAVLALTRVGQYVTLRMEAAAAVGDIAEAADLFHLATALEDLIASEAEVTCAMFATGMRRYLAFSITRCLNRRQLNEAMLKLCQERFVTHPGHPFFLKAFEMDNAEIVHAFSSPDKLRSLGTPTGFESKWMQFLFQFISPANLAVKCRCFLQDAGLLRDGDWAGLLQAGRERREQIDKIPAGWKFLLGVGSIFALASDSSPLFRRLARNEMHLRAVGVACAVERYRLKTGRLPESLAELSPELLPDIPRDLDRQPIRYRALGNRSILWSVGLNLTDDWHGNPESAMEMRIGKEDSSEIELLDWQWQFGAN